MKKMIINENQKGFLFKNGKYTKTLDAGKYHLFGGRDIEISNLEQPIVCSKCALETLLADKAIADRVAVAEVGDTEKRSTAALQIISVCVKRRTSYA